MIEVKGFKYVGLLIKKKDQSFDDFVEYWKEIYMVIIFKLFGFCVYVLNLIDWCVYLDLFIDGFLELWFDLFEDVVVVFDFLIGKVVFIDVFNFVDIVVVIYVIEIKKL